MKKSKKILIAAAAVVLCLAIVCGVGYAVLRGRVPANRDDVQKRSDFVAQRMYAVSMMPNEDEGAYETETLTGIDRYWRANHSVGRGIEAVLQCSKDGELVVLSGDLPGESNAEILYGEDVKVSDLTLDKLQKINLLYNVEDEDGFMTYRTISDRTVLYVSVQSLQDYIAGFALSTKSVALHFLRFKDESALPDLHKAIDKVNEAVKGSGIATNVVLCLESDEGAAYADATYPELQRAATPKECAKLSRAALFGRDMTDTKYVLVYTDANGKYAREQFIRFAQNCGLAVVLYDNGAIDAEKDAQRILALEEYGASGFATRRPETVIQILRDARQAEKESRLAADSTAAQ